MMEAFHLKAKILVLILLYGHSHADTNMDVGREFSDADNSNDESSYQTSLNNLLGSISTNVALNNGFYKTTMHESSHKIYGLVQCRGDVSARDCENCTKGSVTVALQQYSKSRQVSVWFTWCFLRYSDENFFGDYEQGYVRLDLGAGSDEPAVVSKAHAFMGELISEAPKQQLMFQVGVVDVGQSGKRYGMAQCTRDMSRKDCSKCLDALWDDIQGSKLSDKRRWEIYGKSCSMWYHDYQFYFNVSTTTVSGGNRRSSYGGLTAGIIILTMLASLVILC